MNKNISKIRYPNKISSSPSPKSKVPKSRPIGLGLTLNRNRKLNVLCSVLFFFKKGGVFYVV